MAICNSSVLNNVRNTCISEVLTVDFPHWIQPKSKKWLYYVG